MYTCCTVVHHGCLFTPEKYPHLYICFNSQWIVIRHQENFSHYMFAPDNGAFFIGGRSSRIVSSANWPYFVDRPIGFDRTDGAQLPNQNTVESAIHRSRATSATSSSPAHRPATGHRKVAIPASFCCRPQRARSAAPDCIISPQRWRSVRQTAAAACPRPFSDRYDQRNNNFAPNSAGRRNSMSAKRTNDYGIVLEIWFRSQRRWRRQTSGWALSWSCSSLRYGLDPPTRRSLTPPSKDRDDAGICTVAGCYVTGAIIRRGHGWIWRNSLNGVLCYCETNDRGMYHHDNAILWY